MHTVLSYDSDKCEEGTQRREKGACVWRCRVWNFMWGCQGDSMEITLSKGLKDGTDLVM